MMVKRYNGGVKNLSRGHTNFILWISLSFTIHAILAAGIIISQKFQKKIFYNPAYEVELLPRNEIVRRPEEVQRKEEIRPPEKLKKEKIKPEVRKQKRPAVTSKIRKDAVRPEDAVAKIKEKIAAEEAVEKIRKKIKTTNIGGEVKVAATPPSRVYRYDELDAELRAYFEKISQMIKGAWSLPEDLRNKGLKTILSIHILRDGTVASLWIEEGSGNRFYDESALRAINKVNPLPPLPKGWKEGAIDLGLRF